MKAVPDSMLWVSYAANPEGMRRQVLDRAVRQRVRLYSSAYILNEVARVLVEDFNKTQRFATLSAHAILRLTRLVPVPKSVRSFVVDDPNDDPIVETAMRAKADYLVTQDKAILSIGQIHDLRIMTIQEFAQLLAHNE
jgi:putative PIN family toxin of toxin-antitoxin system